MTYLRGSFYLLVLVSLFAVGTVGCGGGGSGGGVASGPPLHLFSGTYSVVSFSGENGTTDEAQVQWGEITADGAGMVTGGSVMENANGSVSGAIAQSPAAYTIDADRTLTILSGTTPFYVGRISADGKITSLASVASGQPAGIVILARKEGTYSDASLSGIYHLMMVAYDYSNGNDITYWGSLTFNGVSATGAGTLGANIAGTVTPFSPVSSTYSVATDGLVSMTIGSFLMAGALGDGGNLVLLGGNTISAGAPGMAVLIKGSTGASATLFDGAYGQIGLYMGASPTAIEWSSSTYSSVSDGMGGLSVLDGGTINSDGVVTTDAGYDLNYAVASGGGLTMQSGAFAGGVSPSGSFAAVAGGTGGGSDNQFYFYVR